MNLSLREEFMWCTDVCAKLIAFVFKVPHRSTFLPVLKRSINTRPIAPKKFHGPRIQPQAKKMLNE